MQSSCNPLPASARTNHLLFHLTALVLVLNLLDAIFTMIHVASGKATEANPLMAGVLANSTVLFVATKLALVSLGLSLLWRLRARLSAVAGLIISVATYACINFYHVAALV